MDTRIGVTGRDDVPSQGREVGRARRRLIGLLTLGLALAVPGAAAGTEPASGDWVVLCHDPGRQLVQRTLAADCAGEIVSEDEARAIRARRLGGAFLGLPDASPPRLPGEARAPAAAPAGRPYRQVHRDWVVLCSDRPVDGVSARCGMLAAASTAGQSVQVLPYGDRPQLALTLRAPSFDHRAGVMLRIDAQAPLMLAEGGRGLGVHREAAAAFVTDAAVNRALLRQAAAGRWLSLSYRSLTGDTVRRRFSLLGFTAALEDLRRVAGSPR